MTSDDPDDDPDTDAVATPRGNLEAQHMIFKYLPPWDMGKAVEIAWFSFTLLIVGTFIIRGLGQFLGYFQPVCELPHCFLSDDEAGPR